MQGLKVRTTQNFVPIAATRQLKMTDFAATAEPPYTLNDLGN
jgi:hypothetical protein